jgi:hypothetical protein
MDVRIANWQRSYGIGQSIVKSATMAPLTRPEGRPRYVVSANRGQSYLLWVEDDCGLGYLVALVATFSYARRRLWKTSFCAFVLTLFTVGCGGEAARKLESGFPLDIPESSLDFGTSWIQDSLRIKLSVHNVMDRTVDVTHVTTSCTCTDVDRRSFSVPPHGVESVAVTLNLARKLTQNLVEGPTDFEAYITLSVAGPAPNASRWRIHGKVESPIAISPAPLALRFVAGCEPPPFSWQVVAAKEVRSLRLCSAEGVENARLDLVDPPNVYRLSVKPKRRTAVGRVLAKVTVQASSDRELPPTTVVIDGRVEPPVRFDPPVVSFGTLNVGQSATKEMSLVSVNGVPFSIEGIKIDEDAGAAVRWDAHKTSAAHAIQVSQKSTTIGTQTTLLKASVRIARSDLAPFEIELPIAYSGTQPGS